MDPNYPYNTHTHRQGSRSLANTTDSSRYPPGYQYPSSPQQGGAYAPAQGQPGFESSSSSYPPYYVPDPHRVQGQSVSPASYPGAVRKCPLFPEHTRCLMLRLPAPAAPYAGGHAASAPGAHPGHPYAPPGQVPLSSSPGPAYRTPHGQPSSPQYPPHSSYTNQYLPTPASVALPHGHHAHRSPNAYTHPSLSSHHHHHHQQHPQLQQQQQPPSPEMERFPCDKCDKTFSRAHDRKRHYESQHTAHPYLHKCRFCNKEFSRADSLKRHIDNGCEKDPSFNDGSVPT